MNSGKMLNRRCGSHRPPSFTRIVSHFTMRVNRTVKAIAAVCAAALVVCWITFLARLYREDPMLFISRVAYDWHDPRFAAFHRLYARIHVGMNRNELQQVIERVYPANGRRKPPRFHVDRPTEITLFMENGGCEGIILGLANGRIVSKHYSAD